MEFGLSSEQTLLKDTVNRFLSDQVPLDLVRKIAAGDADDSSVWAGLSELGIPGLLIPESAGGVGLSQLDAVVVAECLGYHVTPSPFISAAVIAPTALVSAGGFDELLAAMATGATRVGVAFSEAVGARGDAGVTVTDGKLNGKSLFALDSKADQYLVATNAGHLYLVSADQVSVKNLTTVDQTRSTCELIYDNAEAVLVSDDPAIFTKALDCGRVMQAADSLGAAQCMLDQAVVYAKQRVQFNRVIASFQAVKHMCAEMVSHLEPCRSFVWYAGHALDHVPEDSRVTACQVKAHVSEVGQFVAKTSTEVHGGMGFTDLVGLHFWFKRIGANRQLLGSPELCREDAAKAQQLVA